MVRRNLQGRQGIRDGKLQKAVCGRRVSGRIVWGFGVKEYRGKRLEII